MKFGEKLTMLRKENGFSQEELAERLGVSRQAVGKWECGMASPEIEKLIGMSQVFGVTVDQLVKEEDFCCKEMIRQEDVADAGILEFLLQAKKNTYAAKCERADSCRINSLDYQYKEGEFFYLDSYVGSEKFAGEEVVWYKERPVWSMNYCGRVIGEEFSGDFLKEALLLVPKEKPFRGPSIYQNGKYTYHCKVEGDFLWYHGNEEIYYDGKKVYECYFHGAKLK